MANWELGVVFAPQSGSKELKKRIIDSLPLDVLRAKKYQKYDKPFIMEKQVMYGLL